VFRGIPYAQPPLGALRFAAPRPPEPWSGTRDASAFGASAPQNPVALPLPGLDVGATGEDCLVLNVWTPDTDAMRRPVLVWIHGGGFMIGSASQSLYDGAALAERGDVVVVTLNYRLGCLGFLYPARLGLEGAVANAGLRDQVTALRWVRENIEAFGGDPANVTIFGESAGGMSVATLLGVPAARGLFRRAIAQSGAVHNVHDPEAAARVSAGFLDELGVSPGESSSRLRELPVARLLEAQREALAALDPPAGLLPFQPVVDGDFLPRPPLDAVRSGAVAGVSLLIGTTRDEYRLFAFVDPDAVQLDEAGLTGRLAPRLAGADAAGIVGRYREARRGLLPVDPPALYFAIETDRLFRIPAIRLAEAHSQHQRQTFMYRFDWRSPLANGALGACHAIDLPFVFGNHARGQTRTFAGDGPDAGLLAARTMDAWIAFARSGDPGHPGLPDWAAYETALRSTLIFDRECRLERDPEGDERCLWDGLL
jgi:para-nitrobenzyl esterase